MHGSCVTFTNLTLGYDQHPAIHHLNGSFKTGDLTAVVGSNGSGKSTLLKGIAGVLKPLSGEISVKKNLRIAYLPQKTNIDTNFPARVYDLLLLGLWHEVGLFHKVLRHHRQKISEALHHVGLAGFETRALNSLSGGQMQRVLFARTLLQNADLVLLDEPFNALDSQCVLDLLSIIKTWHLHHKTIIVVLHDLDIIRHFFPKTIILARHLVKWGKTDDVLPLEKIISENPFNEAWVNDAPWCDHDRFISHHKT